VIQDTAQNGVPVPRISSTQRNAWLPRFVGEASGVGFMRYIMNAIRKNWSSSPFRQTLTERTVLPTPGKSVPNPLPSQQKAAKMINE
jgi:hypothetical protein